MSTPDKKSKESQMGNSSHKYQPNDVVLAKVRGFSAWPGIIMDDKNVPSAVLSERPVVRNRDLYTIRFFPAADYHWAFAKDLELLTTQKIDQFLSSQSRKKGDLRKAYELARDPMAWNEEQNEIVHNYELSLKEAAEEEEENQDQLQDEEDEAAEDDEDEAPVKKRKQAPESGGRDTADKRKKSKAAEAAKSKPAEKPSSKAAANGDDSMAQDEALDPETRKVKDWRMKLQKAFLPKDGVIKAEEMPALDSILKTVEDYQDMTADQLRATKIGKVTKKIMQLADIPRDDEFNFRTRSEALCSKWGAILSGNGATKENGAASTETKPAVAASAAEVAGEPKESKEDKSDKELAQEKEGDDKDSKKEATAAAA
ncbi:hypothetical protein BCV70DRAFT_57851 [Testicularia cyperi]|uniref:PWWP domain-containing protein n=1 Tax=Testicularia cyperi TaxID=1882483 RepID=A0A317XV39_9BASI|nr:hypothetical protein BCV70DRAFT_57851 [Testicularia cyperi]